ncbi:2,5-diamino-6-(ribosylamino)-4(3H)-pyrimidinone 5'-phosphate reductase [Nitrososphaera sp.]|uniref:2,5-diamino-6-(ribosylamino)-4(3H)-pyrimidinone 5'-phosphate reductase n=1 Tax=Nitrososphaera sp. TaxID=1971748 RepID=UPI00317EFE3B
MKVTINAAMTLDGKIATAAGDSAISSKDDLKRVHRLRTTSDAVMVGISTVLADDPMLTARLARGRNPARIVVDSRGRIPSESRLLRTARETRTMVAVTERAAKEAVGRIEESGAEVIVAGKESVDLRALFSALEKKGIRKILVEGGGELNWSVLRLGLADRLIVTVAPRIAGGRLAPTLVEGDGFDQISKGIRLKLAKAERKKTGELVLHYIPGKIHSTF